MLKHEEVEAAVNRHGWDYVLSRLAPQLHPAIEANGKHVPCPSHGGTDGFRLYNDYRLSGGGVCNTCGNYPNGFLLLQWTNGWSYLETLTAIAQVVGVSDDGSAYTPPTHNTVQAVQPRQFTKKEMEANDRKREAMRKVMSETIDITDRDAEPLRLYLLRRGLEYAGLPSSQIRFHPNLPYFDKEGKNIGSFPAMISSVADIENNGRAIHRTYLTPDGHKANVPEVKKIMAVPLDKKMTGAAVRLAKPSAVMAVTEGIETGIAVRLGTNLSTYALLTTGNMKNFEFPKELEQLHIFADKDRPSRLPNGKIVIPGKEAAEELSAKAQRAGIRTQIYFPSVEIPDGQKSVDWADMYKMYGKKAFIGLHQQGRVKAA